MTRQRKFLAAAALIAVLGIAVVAIAQGPPPVPKDHPVPIDPQRDAATCFQCHQSVPLPPIEQTSFCTTCHINLHVRFAADQPVVRAAPRPPHPINTQWTSSNCANCHRLQHNGANATHQISADMPNASFCVTCHTVGQVQLTGEESAGDFCARCHNLGVVPEHPTGEGEKAEFCLSCHQEAK